MIQHTPTINYTKLPNFCKGYGALCISTTKIVLQLRYFLCFLAHSVLTQLLHINSTRSVTQAVSANKILHTVVQTKSTKYYVPTFYLCIISFRKELRLRHDYYCERLWFVRGNTRHFNTSFIITSFSLSHTSHLLVLYF